MRKKHIACLMAGVLVVTSLCSVQGKSEKVKNTPKKITLSAKKKTVYQGKTFVIKCKGTKKKVKWSLSKKNIVKVRKKSKTAIKLKAVKTGKVAVTAKIGKKKRKCIITVKSKTITQPMTTTQPTDSATTRTTQLTTTAITTTQPTAITTTQPTATTTTQPTAIMTTQPTAITTTQPTATTTTQPTAITTTQPTATTTTQPTAITTTQPTVTTTTQPSATTTTQQQPTTSGDITEETSSVHAVLESGPREDTPEDLAHRDNEAQADIKSSFESPVFSGEGTFYGGGYEGGCCCLDSMTNGYYVCALNRPQYNIGQMAGTYIELTGPIGTLKMLVADELPEGKTGDIDMNTIAFPHVAKVEDGRVPITWKIIPFPTDEPIKYWIKKDSTEYWMQIQIRNHRYPIQKLELKMADGTYKEVPKRNYNFFEIGAAGLGTPGKGPYTFRVTDIYGQVLEDTIPLMPGYIIDGKANFPY